MVDDLERIRRNLVRIPGDPRAAPQATSLGVSQSTITPELAARPASLQPVDIGGSAANFRFPQFGASFQRAAGAPEVTTRPTTGAGTRGVAALRNVRADTGGRVADQEGAPALGNASPEVASAIASGLGYAANVADFALPGASLPLKGLALVARDYADEAQLGQDLATGEVNVARDSGVSISRSGGPTQVFGDAGDGTGVGDKDFQADLATGNVDVDTSSGVSIGRRGDAGQGSGGDAGSGGGGGGAGTGGCFVEGTEVMMADQSLKAIEDIDVGDMVLAFDTAGVLHPRRVVTLFKHAAKPCARLNGTLVASLEQPFWAQPQWSLPHGGAWSFVALAELSAGDKVMDKNGVAIDVQSIDRLEAECVVFNIEVETDHTYIAGDLRVHNAKDAGGQVYRKPYDAGGMIHRGDASQMGYADRSPGHTTPYDAGGGVTPVAAAQGGGGDYAPSMPPVDAGGMPKAPGGLAPPGNGRVNVPAQEGEYIMSRAATTMAGGPEALDAYQTKARMVMGSDDMMGNTYPQDHHGGAPSAPYATTQLTGPGPNPMYADAPVAPETMNVLVSRLDPDLATALMPLLSPQGQKLVAEAIGHMGIQAQPQAVPGQAPGMVPTNMQPATPAIAAPATNMATPPAPTGAPNLAALRA